MSSARVKSGISRSSIARKRQKKKKPRQIEFDNVRNPTVIFNTMNEWINDVDYIILMNNIANFIRKQLRNRLHEEGIINQTTNEMMMILKRKSNDLSIIITLKRKYCSTELRDAARKIIPSIVNLENNIISIELRDEVRKVICEFKEYESIVDQTTNDIMTILKRESIGSPVVTLKKESANISVLTILKREYPSDESKELINEIIALEKKYSSKLRHATREVVGEIREKKKPKGPSGREISRLLDMKSMLNVVGNVEQYYDIGASEGNITKVVKNYLNIKNVYVFDINVEDRTENEIIYIHNVYDKLDIGNNTADLVSTFMALHHFEDLPKMLSEIKRVLKPGGHFIIREHDAENKYLVSFFDLTHLIYATVLSDEATPEDFVKEFLTHYKTKEKWLELIEESGFKLVKWSYPVVRTKKGKKGKKDFTNAFYALFVLPS
uniref:SAM dependent methyltransferase n=1 Tax=Pithovirus LCPAC401 TaxID=2506595 RepID=A0A481Z8Z4_9VIRU|nr:MAG: SAM dependent methyltransferase [Pithovirus LCPAC401]